MATTQLPDALLVKNYIAGDENALVILINRHQSKIYGFIYSKIDDRDLADDVFQDTFLKVIKTLKSNSYNEEGKFLPWVNRIAHNLIIDHFRKNKRIPIVENGDDYDMLSTIRVYDECIETKMITAQIHADIKNLIEYLPEEQKDVLKMRHYAEMSFKEIAEQTNVSINTALGRMRYALINLRKLIKDNNVKLRL